MSAKIYLGVIAAISLSQAALAFEMPKIPGVNDQSAASTSSLDATASQEMVIRKYIDAASDINQAQIHLANAFGLKDQAAALEATAEAFKSGAVDESSIKKQIEVSKSVNDEVTKRINAGAQLSDEAKTEYANSFLPFGKGVFKASKLGPELSSFSDAAKQQISSASMMDKMQATKKLSAGLYLVTNAPGFLLNASSSLKQIVTYGQNNKIPVPKDATAALEI